MQLREESVERFGRRGPRRRQHQDKKEDGKTHGGNLSDAPFAMLTIVGENRLTLARLETGVLLVDDIGPAAAADDAAVLVAFLERAERIADFHGTPFELISCEMAPPKRRGS
jgi:hypothetical protein